MATDIAEYHAEKLHGEALEWLSPIDPSAKHDEIGASRLPGTCEWILADVDFQRWTQSLPCKDSANVACWIGGPGQGKTYTMYASYNRIGMGII